MTSFSLVHDFHALETTCPVGWPFVYRSSHVISFENKKGRVYVASVSGNIVRWAFGEAGHNKSALDFAKTMYTKDYKGYSSFVLSYQDMASVVKLAPLASADDSSNESKLQLNAVYEFIRQSVFAAERTYAHVPDLNPFRVINLFLGRPVTFGTRNYVSDKTMAQEVKQETKDKVRQETNVKQETKETKAKKPCRNYGTDGTCSYGDKCRFSHELSKITTSTLSAKAEAQAVLKKEFPKEGCCDSLEQFVKLVKDSGAVLPGKHVYGCTIDQPGDLIPTPYLGSLGIQAGADPVYMGELDGSNGQPNVDSLFKFAIVSENNNLDDDRMETVDI